MTHRLHVQNSRSSRGLAADADVQTRNVSRRKFLWDVGGGLGGIAMAHMLGAQGLLADDRTSPTDLKDGLHHPAKVKRIIQLFMTGGASPVDTFDHKPALAAIHGERFDPGEAVESVTGSPGFKALKSPFEFKQHGESGRWVSSVFPELAKCVDDLAFLMSMVSKTNVHGPATYMQNTGFVLPGFPCMGSWVSYALGSLNDNLPTFVVIPDARGLPYNNQGSFSAAFLPVVHQGTIIKPSAPQPIADLRPPDSAKFITRESESDGLALLQQLNRDHLVDRPGDSRLDARISSYELAAKMQLSAPGVLDISRETPHTLRSYGLDDPATESFGRNCIIARRMLEQGVRFVQLWSGAGGPANNWDNHANISTELPPIARSVDKPIAALLADLKQRGLMDDTLVIWTTEFGRMPFSQGSAGRDHNSGSFVTWLAGAGIKPGVAYGESDEWAWKSRLPIYCYDLHATILHLLGIDHTKLTYTFNGAKRRLTDVHGHILNPILSSPVAAVH